MPSMTVFGASTVNRPSDAGLQVGFNASTTQSGFRPEYLMDVDVILSGTLGGSPTFKLQVQDGPTGDWVDVANGSLSAQGQLHLRVFGAAVRLVTHAGTSYGGGANVPRYWMNVTRVLTHAVGKGY